MRIHHEWNSDVVERRAYFIQPWQMGGYGYEGGVCNSSPEKKKHPRIRKTKYESVLEKITRKPDGIWTEENRDAAVQKAEELLRTYLINLAQTQDAATITQLTERIEELQNALRGKPAQTEPTPEKLEARKRHLAQQITAAAVKAQREERKKHLYSPEVIAAKRDQRALKRQSAKEEILTKGGE